MESLGRAARNPATISASASRSKAVTMSVSVNLVPTTCIPLARPVRANVPALRARSLASARRSAVTRHHVRAIRPWRAEPSTATTAMPAAKVTDPINIAITRRHGAVVGALHIYECKADGATRETRDHDADEGHRACGARWQGRQRSVVHGTLTVLLALPSCP